MGSGRLLPGAPPPTGVLPGPETDGAGRGEHRLRWGPGRTGRECPQPRRGREPRLEEAASPPGVTTDPGSPVSNSTPILGDAVPQRPSRGLPEGGEDTG